MLDFLAAEAHVLGSAFSGSELDLLSRECPIPEDLELKAKNAISQLLAKEQLQTEADGCEDPKSFLNTLDWANEPMYPNIARLTEEVISGETKANFRGWRRVADRLLLILSALGVIVLLMAIGYFLDK